MNSHRFKFTLQNLRSYPIPCPTLPVKRWNFWQRAVYRVAECLVPKGLQRLFDFNMAGLPFVQQFPEGEPVIFCGNHRSHLDSILLGSAASMAGRRYVAFMASGRALASNPIFGLMKFLGAFPVWKFNPEPALKYAEISLRAGHAVAIFPEGKRYSSKNPRRGRTGVARVIERLNYAVPVIPFYIHGSAEALTIGGKIPLFGRHISITFDSPIYFHTYKNIMDTYTRLRKITDIIVEKITELMKSTEAIYLEKIEQYTKPWEAFANRLDTPSP